MEVQWSLAAHKICASSSQICFILQVSRFYVKLLGRIWCANFMVCQLVTFSLKIFAKNHRPKTSWWCHISYSKVRRISTRPTSGDLEMFAHKNHGCLVPETYDSDVAAQPTVAIRRFEFRLESWSPKTVKCHGLWPISPQWMSMFHLNSYRCTPWPSVVPPVALTFVRSVPMCGGRRKTSWNGKMELELTFVKPKIIKCILIKLKEKIPTNLYIYISRII